MLQIIARNVNDLYSSSVRVIQEVGIEEQTRNGPALVAPYPIMTAMHRPLERVLFDEERNANPFFHLFEAIWMLAGRADAAWLNNFVKDFGERFAEEQGYLHGAYGQRWRFHFGCDQLELVAEKLAHNPDDRRVVITMWNPMVDLIDTGPTPEIVTIPKDLPCNTHIYPRIRSTPEGKFLDLTVCCRSNDIIWGATGANAVHFSFLLEYLAGLISDKRQMLARPIDPTTGGRSLYNSIGQDGKKLGLVKPGILYQMANNWHAYINTLPNTTPLLGRWDLDSYQTRSNMIEIMPIGTPGKWEFWLEDAKKFLENPQRSGNDYINHWFKSNAANMWQGHTLGRIAKDIGQAERYLLNMTSKDWGTAAIRWLRRREYERKGS
jgi:thymidylate synthase